VVPVVLWPEAEEQQGQQPEDKQVGRGGSAPGRKGQATDEARARAPQKKPQPQPEAAPARLTRAAAKKLAEQLQQQERKAEDMGSTVSQGAGAEAITEGMACLSLQAQQQQQQQQQQQAGKQASAPPTAQPACPAAREAAWAFDVKPSIKACSGEASPVLWRSKRRPNVPAAAAAATPGGTEEGEIRDAGGGTSSAGGGGGARSGGAARGGGGSQRSAGRLQQDGGGGSDVRNLERQQGAWLQQGSSKAEEQRSNSRGPGQPGPYFCTAAGSSGAGAQPEVSEDQGGRAGVELVAWDTNMYMHHLRLVERWARLLAADRRLDHVSLLLPQVGAAAAASSACWWPGWRSPSLLLLLLLACPLLHISRALQRQGGR
jgi:hypothetical protein